MTNGIKGLLIFLFVLSITQGCKNQPAIQEEELILGSYVGEAAGIYYIAEEKGIFKKNALKVIIKPYQAGKIEMEDMLAGKIDIATPAEFAFVAKSFYHDNLKIFAITNTADIQHLIARSDRGIHNANDLKGKKIAIMKHTSSEFALGSYLELNNLNLNDVNIVDLKPNQMAGAIQNGSVDAVLIWEPHIYRIKALLKDNVKILSKNEIAPLYTVMVTTSEVIAKKAEALKRFTESLVEAEQFMLKHNEEAFETVKKNIGADDAYLRYAWPSVHYAVGLPQGILPAMEDEARWMIQNHLTEHQEPPNYIEFIYYDAFKKVNPSAITIAH